MLILKTFFVLIASFQTLYQIPLREEFSQSGYLEIHGQKLPKEIFDALYAKFDNFIDFLEKNPVYAQKIYNAKERFLRTKERNFYSTDFFGFYNESKRKGRHQISFYYSPHFHTFISSRFPELTAVPQISRFLEICLEIQKPYRNLFKEAAAELGLETIFDSEHGEIPILFKVVKYLPSYIATRPHYDGTTFSLFLDSTDNGSLLLTPYKGSFCVNDFFSPLHDETSMLLIPGTLLSEFFIYPTPHIVRQSGKTRYAAVAFAMRPNYTAPKTRYSSLPTFNVE